MDINYINLPISVANKNVLETVYRLLMYDIPRRPSVHAARSNSRPVIY